MCFVDVYWIPVGAGTSRLQRASLRWWEAFEAARARRARGVLYHSALKLGIDGEGVSTLELTPAFVASPVPALMTGPVGARPAGRFKLFRYELRLVPGAVLPDEAWAVGEPVRLSDERAMVERVVELAGLVPAYTWGRRVKGTAEMWTSDSVVSWLLVKAGLEPMDARAPADGRAPGWDAGLAVARRAEQAAAPKRVLRT
jgi:hypothetical protein